MSRASETRLSKLEVRAGVAGRRVFIFGAVEPGKAKKRELIACGEATEDVMPDLRKASVTDPFYSAADLGSRY